MLQRMILSALFLAAACGIVLVPAPDSVAAGSLAAVIGCEPDIGGAFCEAGPFAFGSGYTYGWTTTGNLTVSNGSPSGPLRYIGCWGGGSGGTVTVTVTAPNGDTGTASQYVSCCSGGF